MRSNKARIGGATRREVLQSAAGRASFLSPIERHARQHRSKIARGSAKSNRARPILLFSYFQRKLLSPIGVDGKVPSEDPTALPLPHPSTTH